jgi:hypothetical protein
LAIAARMASSSPYVPAVVFPDHLHGFLGAPVPNHDGRFERLLPSISPEEHERDSPRVFDGEAHGGSP